MALSSHMTLIDLLILGFVIGSNNFAVALALGALGQSSRVYRVMLVFGQNSRRRAADVFGGCRRPGPAMTRSLTSNRYSIIAYAHTLKYLSGKRTGFLDGA
jgi:hypothetical protein